MTRLRPMARSDSDNTDLPVFVKASGRAILAAALVAISLLAPGVLRAAPQHAKSKVPSKARLHKVPPRPPLHKVASRPPAHKATRHTITHTVPSRRVKYRRVRRPRTSRLRGPVRPSSDRIDQIQQALARTGYYQGDPSGRWDSGTISAMKSFQQAHGLAPTGKIDATSLQQLGLGSDIAGLAAPRPMIATADAGQTGPGGE
jgi:Putative peptidoglycan binding domain